MESENENRHHSSPN